MARCPKRKGNHCWHESDHMAYTVNPPVHEHMETCCHCGKRRKVTQRPTAKGGHGPYGPTEYEYKRDVEDIAPGRIVHTAGGRQVNLRQLVDMIRRA